MKLNLLTKIQKRSKKRIGRGLGSGLGKTAGRGQKGQKARGTVPASFIGGTLPLYKKLPYKRGFHRDGIHSSHSLPKKSATLNLNDLKVFKTKSKVNLQTLKDMGLINENDLKTGVKILGDGEVSQALTIQVPLSKTAREKIEKAGGKVDSV